MALCTANRFALPGSPSTCTLDTVLMPLPTWLLLISLPVFYFYSSRSRNRSGIKPPARTGLSKWIHILYIVLLVCAIGMTVLEIARLVAADLGVGLLPATPVGVAIAIAIVVSRRRMSGSSFPLFPYWLLLLIFEAVKVTRLTTLNDMNPTKGTQYPSSDQLLDNQTDLGLYAFFVLVDVYELWQDHRARSFAPVADGLLYERASSR